MTPKIYLIAERNIYIKEPSLYMVQLLHWVEEVVVKIPVNPTASLSVLIKSYLVNITLTQLAAISMSIIK
jgi:hypothetical protein